LPQFFIKSYFVFRVYYVEKLEILKRILSIKSLVILYKKLSVLFSKKSTVNPALLPTIFLRGTGPETLEAEVEFVTKVCGESS
jgi:hypothetical protein